MTNKLTLTEQEELFAKDCKRINLKYEYNGYTGDEKWADRKSTRLNSSHNRESRMPSSA